MKKEIRVVGIDDSSFNKFRDKKVTIIGTFFRGGNFIDGVLSTTADVDGANSTKKISEMIIKSRFRPQFIYRNNALF